MTDTPDSASPSSGPDTRAVPPHDARPENRPSEPAPSAAPTPEADAHSPTSLRQRFGEAASSFGKLDTRPFDERHRRAPWWLRWLRRR